MPRTWSEQPPATVGTSSHWGAPAEGRAAGPWGLPGAQNDRSTQKTGWATTSHHGLLTSRHLKRQGGARLSLMEASPYAWKRNYPHENVRKPIQNNKKTTGIYLFGKGVKYFGHLGITWLTEANTSSGKKDPETTPNNMHFNPFPHRKYQLLILKWLFPYYISSNIITENEKTKAKRNYEIFTLLSICKLLQPGILSSICFPNFSDKTKFIFEIEYG